MYLSNRYAIVLLLLFPFTAFGQAVVLEETPALEEAPSDFGINRRHFIHLSVSYAPLLGSHPTASAVRRGASGAFSIGARYKFEATKWLAMGFETRFRRDWYLFEEDNDARTFPSAVIDDEALRFNFLAQGAYVRLNFKPNRGNMAGIYFDVFGDLLVPFRVSERAQYDDPLTDESVTVIRRKLDYINPVSYQVGARLGAGQFALYGAYRLGDLLDDDAIGTDVGLPRILLGLSVGLY